MKKTYMKPATRVVTLKARPALLAGSGDVGMTGVRMRWSDSAIDDEDGL